MPNATLDVEFAKRYRCMEPAGNILTGPIGTLKGKIVCGNCPEFDDFEKAEEWGKNALAYNFMNGLNGRVFWIKSWVELIVTPPKIQAVELPSLDPEISEEDEALEKEVSEFVHRWKGKK